jgi:ribonuclease P protein component
VLAAAQRLRRSTDFAAAIRGGRRAGRGTLVVHLLVLDEPQFLDEPAQASEARAGFVVSKAVGNAVVRNRVRRRLRHLVRSRLDALPAGALLVVRALPAAAAASYATLGSDLDAALETARKPRRRR